MCVWTGRGGYRNVNVLDDRTRSVSDLIVHNVVIIHLFAFRSDFAWTGSI